MSSDFYLLGISFLSTSLLHCHHFTQDHYHHLFGLLQEPLNWWQVHPRLTHSLHCRMRHHSKVQDPPMAHHFLLSSNKIQGAKHSFFLKNTFCFKIISDFQKTCKSGIKTPHVPVTQVSQFTTSLLLARSLSLSLSFSFYFFCIIWKPIADNIFTLQYIFPVNKNHNLYNCNIIFVTRKLTLLQYNTNIQTSFRYFQ